MTVTELLNRDLRIDWHEAVALVRDMLEALPEGAADSGSLPNFDQMDLMPTGQVRVSETLHTADPVQQFGDMLLVLFGRGDPPVQLRLVASQHYDSVQAYSEALAFFERPDRMATLRELYNRAVAAIPLVAPDVLAADADQAPERETKRPHDPSRFGRLMVFTAGVAALIAIVAAGALYANRSQPAGSEAGLSAQVSKGISGVGAKVGSAVSAIGDKVLGKAPAPAAAAEKPAEVQTVAAARPQRSRRESAADVRDIQGAKLSAFDLATPPAGETATSLSTVPALPRAGVEKAEDRQGEASEDFAYSSTSSGVVPPVGIRPQLPKELPPGIRPADLTRIELVILPDGTVDSVKLIGVPRTVHEAMLLSAVKAWQFHPAMKGGVPVKYRKTIWVAR